MKYKTHLTGFQVMLRFKLIQHSRDEVLMRSLIEYFGFGSIIKYRESVSYWVQKNSDIYTKILPFFKDYLDPPGLGNKAKDF